MKTPDQILRQRLNDVSARYRRLLLQSGLAACWLLLAAAGACVLLWARGANAAVPGAVLVLLVVLPGLLFPLLSAALRKTRDPLWLARRVEARHPNLDARLLAALEQRPAEGAAGLGFLQQSVIREAIDHDNRHNWTALVPMGRLRLAGLAQWATLILLAVVLGVLFNDMRARPAAPGHWFAGGALSGAPEAFTIKVEPEDTEVERGTALLVLARFGGKQLPGEVQLLSRDADGKVRQAQMTKSLDDPVFAGRVPHVEKELEYAVRYGEEQTRWFKASVFDYPELKQADAKLKFPEYTALEEKLVQDTRSVTAVEGTKATFTFHLNKPVKQATLLPREGNSASQPSTAPSAVELTRSTEDPSVYTLSVDLKQSQRFKLKLVDDQDRQNKQPAAELAINVTQNRPPELKLTFPGHDVDVSPIEELSVKAQAWDDFGLKRVGVSYSIAGKDAQDVVLAENVKANEKRDVAQLVSMEKLEAKPDELLSYFVWAEDVGPDGKARRTSSDMFFAEVRDFETIMRQGQPPPGGQNSQQQQQQGGQNAQQAEKLADLQKQVINATWKLIRRETSATLTKEFPADTKLVGESQSDAREQAAALGEKLEDAKSKQYVKEVLKHMDKAMEQLADATARPSVAPLTPALSSEQAAYQALLKLRAREVEVVRGQRNQQQRQQGGQNSASNRRQQQLDQLDLDNEENRYETQRQAQQQQETAEQRETRQVLNRLKELAQRQEDLNKQMQELQAQLQQAKEEAKKEELQRQLARLRDQQQQQLRDTDELRDRMDQPENQQRMADSRQELEQTRENIRKAAENLEKGEVPQASTEGARAGEKLNNLRDQFRKQASNQFSDAMQNLRQEARDLDQKQQELSKQLSEMDRSQQQPKARQPGLRDAGNGNDRQQIAKDLSGQKERMDKVLEEMRKTIEESESSEPLLSKQLYDTVRDVSQQRTQQALDATSQLVDRGFLEEARKAESDATKGVTRLREGVEKAAESVLGDESEALKRARDELDGLKQELDREVGRKTGMANATQPTTRPDAARGERIARGNPATRGSDTRPGEGGEQIARADERPQGGERAGPPSSEGQQQQQGERQGRNGGQQQPGEGQQANQGQPAREGQQPGQGQQPGEGQQPGQAPQQQANAQGGQGPRRGQGQRPGQGQRQGQQGGQGQNGERPQDQANSGQQGDPQQQQPVENQQGQPGEGQAQANGQQPGEGQQPAQGQQARAGGGQRRGGGLRQQQQANAGGRPGDLRQLADGRGGGGQTGGIEQEAAGPLTGENFRDWSDRLRDVEEMVSDPGLRAEAAQIRDRAREVRNEFKRHSKQPNWDLVNETIGQPLAELREKVSQEILRRQSPDALVPIDRDPVPPEYAEQVRRYYEKLGSGVAGASDGASGSTRPSAGGGLR